MLIKKNNFLLIYLQVLQLSKSMSIGEFDVCHEFVNFCKQRPLPDEKKFVILDYMVTSEEFKIFVSFDREKFGHKIIEFIEHIIKDVEKSCLYHYGWKIYFLFVNENIPNEELSNLITITFTAE